eukprot:5343484-Alexandrium_andersonii.AAC.1
MSASLVGSEMCIRDSLEPWRPRSVVSASTEDCPGAPAVGQLDPSLEAVSYTHLTLPTICSV